MESNPYIAEQIAKTGAYTDLVKPVILTSGQLGIFYINTEKLLRDGGEFKKYGGNSRAMIAHAMKQMAVEPEFEKVIKELASQASVINPSMIAGGQRRDWPFSGPVAQVLGRHHVSIYKDQSYELITPGFQLQKPTNGIKECTVLPIADLLTEGSSFYTPLAEGDRGWVPVLRNAGANVTEAMTVVNRLQGGAEMLEGHGIDTWSAVYIDEAFLKKHSSQADIAISYVADPTAWSETYLRENGALAFIDYFNPEKGQTPRAKKFMRRFGELLEEAGKKDELDKACQDNFGESLDELMREVA